MSIEKEKLRKGRRSKSIKVPLFKKSTKIQKTREDSLIREFSFKQQNLVDNFS